MSKIINVGRVTAYAEAVAGGYTGTLEDWERDLANLGTTAAEVEANRQAVAEDKAAVQENLTTVETYKNSAAQSASEALQSAENAHTDALAATAAKEAAQTAQGLAEEARADAVSAKGAAESAQTEANASASAATEAALAAGNAAQTATTQAGAASDSAAAAAQSAEAAAESARTLTIDTTLTQAGQAADAKAAGDEIADLKSALKGDIKNNIDAIGITTAYINWSNNHQYIKTDGTHADISNPVTTQSNVRHIVIACNAGDVFMFSATGGSMSRAYATIDANGSIIRAAHAYAEYTNSKLTIATGETGLIINDTSLNGYVVKINKSFDTVYEEKSVLTSNDDANNVYANGVYRIVSGSVPANLPIESGGLLSVIANANLIHQYYFAPNYSSERFHSVSGGWTDWNNLSLIETITSKLFEWGEWDIDLSSCRTAPATIAANGVWNAGTMYESYLVDVTSYMSSKISIYASATKKCIFGFMTSDVVGNDQTRITTFATGETGRRTVNAGESKTFTIPQDCNFVMIFKTSSGNDFTPSSVMINGYHVKENGDNGSNTIGFDTPMLEQIPLRAINSAQNGRDIPQSIAVRNAYKKAHQLLDLSWIALHPYPKTETPDTYAPAGNVIAVPYSSVKEYNKFVGYNVSIRTFMTAVHNPYSLMYTENTLETHKQSAYGIDYHGVNCGPYFGDVCSSFDLFILGMNIPWTTNQFPYLVKTGKLVKINDQSANGVRLMDIVHEPGHTTIITDIIRDDRGTPTQIYVSEYGPSTRIYTPDEFNERLRTKSGTIYMYMDLYKNLEYAPSEFVAVDGETTPPSYTYNDDICTFAGDYACFNSGEDIYINYTAGVYTQMQIYKGDTLIDTITLDNSEHSIKITPSGYGKYKARLTNGSVHSDYTYFEIVDTTLTASYINGVLTINFSSANGDPVYAEIATRAGFTRGFVELNASEKAAGIVTVDPVKLVTEQLPGVALEPTIYPRILFRGEYGMVANPFYAVQLA